MGDKKFTPKEAAVMVLKKAEELYKASSLAKADSKSYIPNKISGGKELDTYLDQKGVHRPYSNKKVATAIQSGPMSSQRLSAQKESHKQKLSELKSMPKPNLGKSDQSGNNPDAKADADLGEKVEQDVEQHEAQNQDPAHEKPMKGHIKLAKFVGRMEHKKSLKKDDGQTLGQAIGFPGSAPSPVPTPMGKKEE